MKIYKYEYHGGKLTVEALEAKETPKMYKVEYIECRCHYLQIKKDTIGVVDNLYYNMTSASLYLTERDDEKARDLLFKYFDMRISESVKEKEEIDKRISKFAEAEDEILKIKIKEEGE